MSWASDNVNDYMITACKSRRHQSKTNWLQLGLYLTDHFTLTSTETEDYRPGAVNHKNAWISYWITSLHTDWKLHESRLAWSAPLILWRFCVHMRFSTMTPGCMLAILHGRVPHNYAQYTHAGHLESNSFLDYHSYTHRTAWLCGCRDN